MDVKSRSYELPSEVIARIIALAVARGACSITSGATSRDFASAILIALREAGYTIIPAAQSSGGTQIASDEGENPKMDRATALTELKRYQVDGDAEIAHLGADRVLRFLLCAIGYADVIFEYDKVKKWYA